MIDSPFFKFPSTPHLFYSSKNASRSDKLLSEEERVLLLSNHITIEEKIDGANLGISFSTSGDILLQNRGQYVSYPYLGQWEKIPLWLNVFQDSLFDVLENKYILFGEWCYAKHSIYYSSLPNWFIAFDVYDITEKKFLSVQRRNKIINCIELPIVPLIKFGHFDVDEISYLLGKSKFGEGLSEGLYFRYDKDGWLNVRAKYVRNTFSQAIGDHWKNAPLQKNTVLF